MIIASLLAVLTGCGGGSDGGSPATNDLLEGQNFCEPEGQRNYIYTKMKDVYLWYDEIPEIDPASYASNESLLVDIVTPAIQARGKQFPYSYLTTVEAEDALLSNAGYIGFGFSSQLNDSSDAILLREVFPDGPADTAGLIRSDSIIAIDGESVSSLVASGAFSEEPGPYGPAEVGVSVDLTIRHQGGAEEVITVTKDEVDVPTVSYTTTFDASGLKVGYIFFRSFLTPSIDELNAAFQQIAADGVTRLVLDLRYNGGGLVSVAEHLGNLIGGGQHAGETFSKTRFNDKYSSQNYSRSFSSVSDGLPITQVVAITTGGTASSSELVINSLKPYIDVVTVGATSYGKPVGQQRIEFCGNILRGVTFETVNVLDEGDYYTGIEPTCAAEDDLTAELGTVGEDSLDTALYYIENGSCPSSLKFGGAEAQVLHRDMATSTYRDGWDLMNGGLR